MSLEDLNVIMKSKAMLRAKILNYPPDNSPLTKPKPADFANPNVALAVEPPLGNERGPTAYFITRDRGYRWEGPHLLYDPLFETIQARPSYVLRPDGTLLWFVQGTRWNEFWRGDKKKAPEGRPMILASMDGALNWHFLTYIVPSYTDPPKICPYPTILPDGKIVVALRNYWPDWRLHWTEIYVSEDEGLT
ncbi:TPA: hypothetical protein EYP75_03025 [Candidatus Bathyarchaeota archaeon]|nr:hypothetical protein [Candidatus Bathyarchaeota archaeon]